MLKISSRFLRVRLNFHVYAWPFIHCLYFIYARKFYLRSQGKITQQWKSTPWEACSVTAFLKAVILWFLLMFLSSLQQLFSYSLSLSCTDVASKSILACEQALLFGRGARFACPNRRACSQANSIPRTFAHWTGLDWTGLACRHGHFANDQWVFCG